jgi:tetratricopeptide (TPR) repeat protein
MMAVTAATLLPCFLMPKMTGVRSVQANIFSGDDGDFLFWTPEADDVVLIGQEQRAVPLPRQPLPVYSHATQDGGRPGDDALGAGIYEYLRRYPDCEGGYYLADLLRNAYPHYLADIAAQVIMIEEKEVDAPFLRRKITGLKILALLEARPQLYYQLGRSYFEFATMFAELPHCRNHLLAAREYLRRALLLEADNPAALNLLAQIEAWFGMKDEAFRLWQQAAALVAEPTRSALWQRAADLQSAPMESPLIDELEALGETLLWIGSGDFGQALAVLERLQEQGRVMAELPTPEFYYILGHCREQCNEPGQALVAYVQALELDPEFSLARTGFDRLSQGES